MCIHPKARMSLELFVSNLSKDLQSTLASNPVILLDNELVVYKDRIAVDSQEHPIPANPKKPVRKEIQHKYANAIRSYFNQLNKQNNGKVQGFLAQLLHQAPTQQKIYEQLDALIRGSVAATHVIEHFNQENTFYQTIHQDMQKILQLTENKKLQLAEHSHVLTNTPLTYQQLQEQQQTPNTAFFT